jgi:hypothetical protein
VLESAIEAACVKYASKRGCLSVKLQGGTTGTPDRLFLLPGGQPLLVEFKQLTGRLSPRQMLVFDQYGALGHIVLIVRRPKTFKIMLDLLLETV